MVVFALVYFFFFALEAAINVHLQSADPQYDRLETIVRLKYAEGLNAAYYKDYKGMEVLFETRDRDTHSLAWAGKVSFRTSQHDVSPIYELKSLVSVNYIAHPSYFEQHRTYGTATDEAGAPAARAREPLIINNQPYIYKEKGEDCSYYKTWVNGNSLFEWTLGQVYTIKDLENVLESLMINEKFPNYLLYGYSSNGGCLNCVTFSGVLLKRLGINLGSSSVIAGYLDHYLSRTWWGFITTGVDTLTDISAGAVLGYLCPPLRLAMSPWGRVAIGALQVGGEVAIGGVVGEVGNLAVGNWMPGALVKTVLDRQANVRKAATPEIFIEEIYNHREQLNNVRVVRFANNNGIKKLAPFRDAGILDVINRNKWRWQRLDTLPDDIVFADYRFHY